MIPKEKIKLCAENIARSINIKKKGEFVLIKGGFYCYELLEEIGLSVLRKGGIPHIFSYSDYFDESRFKDDQIKVETIGIIPSHYIKMFENIDAYITIEPLEDPSIRNDVPKEKLKAFQKSETAWREILYGMKKEYAPGKKWCYATWPSKKAAAFYNVDYDLFEKFIVDGMSIPTEQLSNITKDVGNHFENAKKVYVNDDFGTDFWVSIEDRVRNLDDGVLSDEQIARGDLGGNLPAGEVFFATHEKQGEGTIFCPLTKVRYYSQKILKNVELVFKNGKLLIDKISADNDIEELISCFKQREELDREMNLPELRTYNVSELGIGCNPIISKAIGYINTDEKINGSVHVAFGSNNHFGGTSNSLMHWDFVTAPKVNITVEYIDGSKRDIMENGKLIDK
ncbi:MAG: aminopeptidase [Promethearchaeota archaeon]|nr:MAG: aminopeptidase [Candidatus Lokiarchaeota archaeon]